jgi:hypothetical protein
MNVRQLLFCKIHNYRFSRLFVAKPYRQYLGTNTLISFCQRLLYVADSRPIIAVIINSIVPPTTHKS